MASFTLQAFKTGTEPRSVTFADEKAAFAETMRLQKSGTFDALRLVRVDDRKVLFDTTKSAKPAPKQKQKQPRSKLLFALVACAMIVGIGMAFAVALVHRY